MNNLLKNYEKDGFVLVKSLLKKNLCKEAKLKTNSLKVKLKIPFSNSAYGYGDVRLKKPYNLILKNKKMNLIVKKLLNSDFNLSHFLLVNKAAWIGPDVEWHQEVFNFNIYASGLNKKKNWKDFIQVFIAFDDHEKQNGCLKVLKGSHKSGFLDYEDIVNINGSHKRRVKTKILDKLVKKYPIKDIQMKRGDVLFFNHLLVHGSTSNLSSKSRLSGLMQFYNNKLIFKNDNFIKYSNFRAKFAKKYFLSSISKLESYKKKLFDFRK